MFSLVLKIKYWIWIAWLRHQIIMMDDYLPWRVKAWIIKRSWCKSIDRMGWQAVTMLWWERATFREDDNARLLIKRLWRYKR